MKKVFQYATLLLAGMSLTACALLPTSNQDIPSKQSQEKKDKKAASNGQVEVKIKEGQFILPSNGAADSKYLALSLEIKNKTDEKIMISSSDIGFYDSEGEKIQPVGVYDDAENFKILKYEDLAKGKTLSGYLVFKVEKDKKYELHYEKKTYDADEKTEEIKLNVDPSSYPDQIEDSKKLASDYLNAVFLGGDAKSKDKAKSSKGKEDFVLGGNLEQDKNDFRAAFAEDFKRKLHDYPFTDKEVNTFIDAYVENNAKRSEISYTVAQYMPNEIVIKIKPRTVSLSKTILNYSKEFSDKHRSEYANLSEFYKAQDKNYADDMMAGLDSRPLLTPERDYQLKFVKTDGKWVLERDFSYESIVISFEGDIS